MQILVIALIVILLAFLVLLSALARRSPKEKQVEDKEQEEYIRDYMEGPEVSVETLSINGVSRACRSW